MTHLVTPTPFEGSHIVLYDVSWDYETLLSAFAEHPKLRITYYQGA